MSLFITLFKQKNQSDNTTNGAISNKLIDTLDQEQQELLEQTPEWQEQQKQIAKEKERIKKEKREQYNAERREQRLQAKLEKQKSTENV